MAFQPMLAEFLVYVLLPNEKNLFMACLALHPKA